MADCDPRSSPRLRPVVPPPSVVLLVGGLAIVAFMVWVWFGHEESREDRGQQQEVPFPASPDSVEIDAAFFELGFTPGAERKGPLKLTYRGAPRDKAEAGRIRDCRLRARVLEGKRRYLQAVKNMEEMREEEIERRKAARLTPVPRNVERPGEFDFLRKQVNDAIQKLHNEAEKRHALAPVHLVEVPLLSPGGTAELGVAGEQDDEVIVQGTGRRDGPGGSGAHVHFTVRGYPSAVSR
jgi:hypothetical protein